MSYIYNDRKEIKRILSQGFRKEVPTYMEILTLAKKYRIEDGLGEKRIYSSLVEFLEDRSVKNIFLIDEMVRVISRRAIQIDKYKEPTYPIFIYESDIESIKTIRNFDYQKIIFSSIVFSRSYGNKNIFSDKEREIKHVINMSGAKISIREFSTTVSRSACVAGIFEHRKGKRDFYLVLEAPPSPVSIKIENDESYIHSGKVYESYNGGVSMWCIGCGKESLKSGQNNKYCDSCSEEIRKNRQKNIMRERRAKDDDGVYLC